MNVELIAKLIVSWFAIVLTALLIFGAITLIGMPGFRWLGFTLLAVLPFPIAVLLATWDKQ